MTEAQQAPVCDLPSEQEPPQPALHVHADHLSSPKPKNLPSPEPAQHSTSSPNPESPVSTNDTDAQPPAPLTSTDPECVKPTPPAAGVVPVNPQRVTALPLPNDLISESEKIRVVLQRHQAANDRFDNLKARIRVAAAEIAAAKQTRTEKEKSELAEHVERILDGGEMDETSDEDEMKATTETPDAMSTVEESIKKLEGFTERLEATNDVLQDIAVQLETTLAHCRAFTAAVRRNQELAELAMPLELCPSPVTGEMPPAEYHEALQSEKKILALPIEDLHRLAKFYDPTWESDALPADASRILFAHALCYIIRGRAAAARPARVDWTTMFPAFAPAAISLLILMAMIYLSAVCSSAL